LKSFSNSSFQRVSSLQASVPAFDSPDLPITLPVSPFDGLFSNPAQNRQQLIAVNLNPQSEITKNSAMSLNIPETIDTSYKDMDLGDNDSEYGSDEQTDDDMPFAWPAHDVSNSEPSMNAYLGNGETGQNSLLHQCVMPPPLVGFGEAETCNSGKVLDANNKLSYLMSPYEEIKT
jgi:hypothetical protein